jgi:hypothetical protein
MKLSTTKEKVVDMLSVKTFTEFLDYVHTNKVDIIVMNREQVHEEERLGDLARDVYLLTEARKMTYDCTLYKSLSISELFSNFGTFIQKVTNAEPSLTKSSGGLRLAHVINVFI